ncbi:MAG: hypothetical protein A2Y38_22770 [Spirochaetes bacterium GWB1_59_5]|nr:MAG: hypothetical protein A2Y38_22770 [Spirochaetes bacterium GWB1_59_5]
MSTIAVSDVDIRTNRIPDQYIALPLAFALAENLALGLRFAVDRFLESVVVLFAFLIFRRLVKGKFGLGDIKLISASTMAFGIVGVLVEVFFASLLGVIWAMLALKKGGRFPFAPFLALGMLIATLSNPYLQAFLYS